ncbi:hypothetical protein KUTeg_021376 [Tegillarca granosa]|uniref:Ion transport domain-containing protein n=1 Tax=Tegillarca granosa TaxID=220873 RepID=A0ABQ9EAL1_TEGGR|nr:hypothetical protein KUTeg_021376 [Tegillarca granosa]
MIIKHKSDVKYLNIKKRNKRILQKGIKEEPTMCRPDEILFLTLNKAIHNILRYMLCCSIIYAGFVFCGWAVLGPYHLKFKSLQSTAECLFATINGDDLFGTLSNFTVANDEFIWWFSRAFMFVYIAIFTAIAINLFIAILTDTYETIKQYCKHGFPMSELLEFIYQDEIYSPLRGCKYRSIFCCLCTSCSREIWQVSSC